MDVLDHLLQDSGILGTLFLGLAGLTALLGLVASVGWARGVRVSPLLPLAPVGVAALLPLTHGSQAAHAAMDALAKDPSPDPVVDASVAAMVAVPMLELGVAGALLIVIVAGGVIAVSRSPRGPVEPVLALLLGIPVVVGGAAAALAGDHLPWSAVATGLLLLPVVVGLAAKPGAPASSAGALAGSASATAYAALVVLLELAALNVDYAGVHGALEAGGGAASLLGELDRARAGLPFVWLACLAAFAIAVVGVVNATQRDRTVDNALLWGSLLPVVALQAQLAFDPVGRLLVQLVEWMP